MADIKITFKKTGGVEVKVINGSGESCKQLTAGLERKLGTVQSDVALPEMYEQTKESEAHVQY